MAFSVASWNVEFFGSRRKGGSHADVAERVDRVFDYLKDEIDADVFAIYEVNGRSVFDKVISDFPDYSWQITEGGGAQQILVGFRIPAFVSQRLEFSKGFAGLLRPGLLVTAIHEGQNYPMLFLHLKSADHPVDFGVRTYQHERARSLRKALDRATAPKRSNFIVAGDFNTLGMDVTFSDSDLAIADEIARLNDMYSSRHDQMRVRPKTAEATFWNGPGSSSPPVDLDHVVAANRVAFEQDQDGNEVEVKGWPEATTDVDRKAWINDFSDHALLRFTVTGAEET